MKHAILYIPLMIFVWGCSKTSMTDSISVSETQRQREVCLDWYGYRIDTKKAINDLNLKTCWLEPGLHQGSIGGTQFHRFPTTIR